VEEFIGIRWLNWIGHVYRMDIKRKLSQVFNNNPQGSRLRGRSKNRWRNCVQTDVDKCKITDWKERSLNRGEWEKSSKEAKVPIELKYHIRKRRIRSSGRIEIEAYFLKISSASSC